MAKQDISTELFTIAKTYKSGGCVHIMNGVDKSKPDYKIIFTLASLFAKEGKEVFLLTSCHFKSEEYKVVFGSLTGTKFERKCPDLLVDGKFYEKAYTYYPFRRDWIPEIVFNSKL